MLLTNLCIILPYVYIIYIGINLYLSVLYILLKFQLELSQPTNSFNYLKILVFN